MLNDKNQKHFLYSQVRSKGNHFTTPVQYITQNFSESKQVRQIKQIWTGMEEEKLSLFVDDTLFYFT